MIIKVGQIGIFIFLTSASVFGRGDSTKLVKKWKLIKYEAFENVRNSYAYIYADDETAKKYDETVNLLLDSVYYDFKSDNTLTYVDLENNKLIKRRAKWLLDKDELSIVELDRPYSRKAKIIKLTDKELVFAPIISGVVGESPMTFKVHL